MRSGSSDKQRKSAQYAGRSSYRKSWVRDRTLHQAPAKPARGRLDKRPQSAQLFLELEKSALHIASEIINNHQHWWGNREELIEYIKHEASVFEDWRYAHEKEFLCSSPDTLLMLADAFRKTVSVLHPDLRSAFRL